MMIIPFRADLGDLSFNIYHSTNNLFTLTASVHIFAYQFKHDERKGKAFLAIFQGKAGSFYLDCRFISHGFYVAREYSCQFMPVKKLWF